MVDPPQPILAQWLASTLLGAHNIEQTKLLNWSDLGLLPGTTVCFPAPQRQLLGTLATPQTVAAVLRWNFQQLGESVMGGNDFYLDPHTKHYTGMQRVLKGWCASIRWADKVMHGDFIHTAPWWRICAGEPSSAPDRDTPARGVNNILPGITFGRSARLTARWRRNCDGEPPKLPIAKAGGSE